MSLEAAVWADDGRARVALRELRDLQQDSGDRGAMISPATSRKVAAYLTRENPSIEFRRRVAELATAGDEASLLALLDMNAVTRGA